MVLAIRPVVGILMALLLAGPSFANSTSATSGASVSQDPKKESRWSGFANTSRSTNLIDHQDGSRGDYMEYMARLNFKLSKTFSLSAQTGYAQDLKDSQSDDFSNTTITLQRRPVELGSYLLGSYRVGLVAPTSKMASKGQGLIASVTTGGTLSINPEHLVSGLEISGSLNLNRNFHQYETALYGAVNTQYSSSQALSLAYSFASGISLSASFAHMNTWSYQNVMRTAFDFSQEISYEVNPKVTIAAGHTNSGSTLKANGIDSNIQLLDENTSMVYGSLTLVF